MKFLAQFFLLLTIGSCFLACGQFEPVNNGGFGGGTSPNLLPSEEESLRPIAEIQQARHIEFSAWMPIENDNAPVELYFDLANGEMSAVDLSKPGSTFTHCVPSQVSADMKSQIQQLKLCEYSPKPKSFEDSTNCAYIFEGAYATIIDSNFEKFDLGARSSSCAAKIDVCPELIGQFKEMLIRTQLKMFEITEYFTKESYCD